MWMCVQNVLSFIDCTVIPYLTVIKNNKLIQENSISAVEGKQSGGYDMADVEMYIYARSLIYQDN